VAGPVLVSVHTGQVMYAILGDAYWPVRIIVEGYAYGTFLSVLCMTYSTRLAAGPVHVCMCIQDR
jgi:hypothetical protein